MARTTIFQRMNTQEAVIDAIENGCTVSEAAECAGVTRACIYSWLKKGEAGTRSDDQVNLTEYIDFYQRFNSAVGRQP